MRAEQMHTNPNGDLIKNIVLLSLVVLAILATWLAGRIPVARWLQRHVLWHKTVFYLLSFYPLASLAGTAIYFMLQAQGSSYNLIVFASGCIISPAATSLNRCSRRIVNWHTLLWLINICATFWYGCLFLLYMLFARAV